MFSCTCFHPRAAEAPTPLVPLPPLEEISWGNAERRGWLTPFHESLSALTFMSNYRSISVLDYLKMTNTALGQMFLTGIHPTLSYADKQHVMETLSCSGDDTTLRKLYSDLKKDDSVFLRQHILPYCNKETLLSIITEKPLRYSCIPDKWKKWTEEILTSASISREHKHYFLDNLYPVMEELRELDRFYLLFLAQNADFKALIEVYASPTFIAQLAILRRKTLGILEASLARGTMTDRMGYTEKQFFIELFLSQKDHPSAVHVAYEINYLEWISVKDILKEKFTHYFLQLTLQIANCLHEGTLERHSRGDWLCALSLANITPSPLIQEWVISFSHHLNGNDISFMPKNIASLLSTYVFIVHPEKLISYFQDCYKAAGDIKFLYEKLLPQDEYVFNGSHPSELTLAIYMSLNEEEKRRICPILPEHVRDAWLSLSPEEVLHPRFIIAFRLESLLNSEADHSFIFGEIQRTLSFKHIVQRNPASPLTLLKADRSIFKTPDHFLDLAQTLPKTLLPFFFYHFHPFIGSFSEIQKPLWSNIAAEMLLEYPAYDQNTDYNVLRVFYLFVLKTKIFESTCCSFAEKAIQQDPETTMKFIKTMEWFFCQGDFSYMDKHNLFKTIGSHVSLGLIHFGANLIISSFLKCELNLINTDHFILFIKDLFPDKSRELTELSQELHRKLDAEQFEALRLLLIKDRDLLHIIPPEEAP